MLARDPFTSIVGISRGGLIPAAIVARELDIRIMDTLCIATYQYRDQAESGQILKGVAGDGEDVLIIDAMVDTGTTGQIVRSMLPKAYFATLYAKPAGKHLVDTFITEVSQDTWVLFPWDSEVQYTAPLVK